MALKDVVKTVLDVVAPQIELAAEAAIQKELDGLIDHLTTKLTELIPGNVDNVVAEAIKPQLKVIAKEYLLAQAEKISDKV